ncbi:unnamed protein product [Musa acuminata subsp. malaccensis]|uniref:(wild Malaysian banana) hypothetical protein n=1 Tax=Musa acuminata subsp. malaccensis TaxID=214687 RepID=A0A804JN98_MUSAM|nr:PREDICTED: probable E3 ubiquitin ligase SUD1 [Musa acuminata subsp. malaccensis]CAG1848179.1 unnamed protein product [Musa acuminata subsp. malaccensis]
MADVAPRNGVEPHAAVLVAIAGSGGRSAAGGRDGDAETLPDAEKGACVVVDVGCGGQGTDVGGSDREDEKVCRICHLSPAGGEEGSGLIQLGCGCKGELGVAHRHCAEEWFRLKGNRYCEICGVNAKNIAGEEGSRSMEERHVRREPSIPHSHSLESDERGGCWRRQSYCNFLMACFIIASIFLWFFRVSMF